MARGNYVNILHALGLFSLVLFIQKCQATTFKVGGSSGWSVPSDNSPVYNQWAENMRFQIGDSLMFVYPSGRDSVLQVTKEDYNNCTIASPRAKFTDGNTMFKFNHSGPFYFISGNTDNCLKNEKLVVVVLADRTNKKSTPPTTQSPPSPAPAAASTPPTEEVTPAPSAESPPPSGAASIVMSFVGSLGAFVGSSLLLAF